MLFCVNVRNAMNLFAPDCGSWGLTARGTSMRSELNPAGRESFVLGQLQQLYGFPGALAAVIGY